MDFQAHFGILISSVRERAKCWLLRMGYDLIMHISGYISSPVVVAIDLCIRVDCNRVLCPMWLSGCYAQKESATRT